MNRNITYALLSVLRQIEESGNIVVARGQEQREILSSLTKILYPAERFLILPGRRNNVFAQIAETMWVLSGRNDIAFLSRYLPRAANFSDDGKTWRAGYGVRLRNWGAQGIDQLMGIIARLAEDHNTKRAVISLYDPNTDFCDTKDVPCNNWLQFIHRDGILNLNVTLRANDAIWGFSGINFFEWSVLHEIIANSFGWKMGTLSWYVGTFHVYERHYETANNLLRLQNPKSIYEYGVKPTPVGLAAGALDSTLRLFFKAENFSGTGAFQDSAAEENKICDPFFRQAAIMMRIYNLLLYGRSRRDILAALQELEGDFLLAAAEYVFRKWKQDKALLEFLPGEAEAFFTAYLRLLAAAERKSALPGQIGAGEGVSA